MSNSSDRGRRPRGVCPACSAVREVGLDGLFHLHRLADGSRCPGSRVPLHVPGRDQRTVSVFALEHDQRDGNVLLARMSPRRDRASLMITAGCTTRATGVTVTLGPRAVGELVESIDEWALAVAASTGSWHAAALGTGVLGAPPRARWSTALPDARVIAGEGAGLLKLRTCMGDLPLLAVAAVRRDGDPSSAYAVLDRGQACSLRDGLRSWLRWTRFLEGSGLL